MKSSELKNGTWFVSTCDYQEWSAVKFTSIPGRIARAKRFPLVPASIPQGAEIKPGDLCDFTVIAMTAHESDAQMIAQMYSCLPHDSTHQLSSDFWVWVYGYKTTGGVVLCGDYLRCAKPEGKIADQAIL